jgi:CHAT domain-containing protein/tetratricopeptide (TPR) repeat protein
MHSTRRNIFRLLALLLALPVCTFAQQAAAPSPEVGRPLRVGMSGGETHLYRVALGAGQYLRALVEQQGMDVSVALTAPGGKRLLEVDSPNGSYGAEPLSIVVEDSGDYLIEVRSPDKKAQAGFYELRIEARREPTPSDLTRVRAERTFAEALKLNSQPAAQAKREALEKFESLLPLFRSLEDRGMELFVLRLAGFAYHTSGRLQPALSYYNQALSLSQSLGDRRTEAVLLNNIGGVYDILGEPRQALDYYGRALPLLEALNNNAVRGDALNNTGVIYYQLGDLQRALDFYNRALPLRRAGSNRRKEADTLDNIGLVYTATGEPRRALEHFEHSLELRRAAKDAQGEANTLDNIGWTHTEMGELAEALSHHERALPLRRTAGDRRGEAITLDDIGAAQASLLEPQKALEQHQLALELARAVGDRHEEAVALASVGKVHALAGRSQEALEYYGKALSTSGELGARRLEARIRQAVASVERDRGNLDEARVQMDAALSIIEDIRAEVASPQLRTSFFASKQDAYEFEIDLLMRMHGREPSKGYDAAALQVSERARARGLLETLSEAGVDLRQGADPALLGRERELSQRLSAKAARLVSLLGRQDRQEQAVALKKEVGVLEEEQQQVLGEIRRSSPHYAAVTQPRPLDLREIQQLLDPDTLLLEYSLGAERGYLWAVTRDGLRSFQLPGRERVEQAARRLYELVTARSISNKGESARLRQERIGRADSQTPEAAGELGRMVLGPAASELGAKRLVVVADGALQYIPFAMLPARNGGLPGVAGYRPLIVEHEVVSLPSASTLSVQRRELAGRKAAPNNIALIADPVFDGNDERVVSKAKRAEAPATSNDEETAATRTLEHLTAQAAGAQSGPRIPRLPYTRSEAEQILAVAPKARNLKAVDFKASLATALGGELHKYRYVHFATHGYIDSERPALSAVVLSLVNERGEPQDGLLKTQEIYNLDLPAELVVLSACQTGLGKEVKGEGLVGLTRGFMYAGAARVIVSLWNVSDKGTADLMSRLYKGMLKEGLRPTAALRAAQLEVWKQKQWQSPYYWAAFVQQGEWR